VTLPPASFRQSYPDIGQAVAVLVDAALLVGFSPLSLPERGLWPQRICPEPSKCVTDLADRQTTKMKPLLRGILMDVAPFICCGRLGVVLVPRG